MKGMQQSRKSCIRRCRKNYGEAVINTHSSWIAERDECNGIRVFSFVCRKAKRSSQETWNGLGATINTRCTHTTANMRTKKNCTANNIIFCDSLINYLIILVICIRALFRAIVSNRVYSFCINAHITRWYCRCPICPPTGIPSTVEYQHVERWEKTQENHHQLRLTRMHTIANVGNFDKQISAWTTWLRESSSDRYTSSGYSGFALVAWFFWCIPILQMYVVRTGHAYNARIHKNPIKIADIMQHRAEMRDRSRIFSHLTAEPATILHCWPFKVAAISNLFRVLVDGWKLQIGRTESKMNRNPFIILIVSINLRAPSENVYGHVRGLSKAHTSALSSFFLGWARCLRWETHLATC